LDFRLNEKLPRIASTKPYAVEVEAGKKYSWCTCGMSAKEPFCDDSHKKFKNADGSAMMKSLKFDAAESKKVYLCGCKHTQNPPFCDQSHKKI
jgi:CDGSH-type Zn-finger protein